VQLLEPGMHLSSIAFFNTSVQRFMQQVRDPK
jgi:hypothetical protein